MVIIRGWWFCCVVNYLSKISIRVFNLFDVFILIVFFSYFEEDVYKKIGYGIV